VTAVRVVAKEAVANGVVAVTFAPVESPELPEWDAGAHVEVLIEGVPTRQYSLSGDPANRSIWRLGVLREPAGRGTSRYIHDELAVGDTLRIVGPRNHFALVDAPEYVFIAGGIGITPILPMARAAEQVGAQWHLTYGGRTRESMAFLDELSAYGDKVTIVPQDEMGMLNLPELLGEPREGVKIYCCGPVPLLDAVEEHCQKWPNGALHVERFSAKALTAPVLTGPFEVTLARSGISVQVPPEKSILQAVEAAGVTVRSSCAEGTCGTCETVVLGGIPDHRDSVLSSEEQRKGETMMICVSRSCTPTIVLDL